MVLLIVFFTCLDHEIRLPYLPLKANSMIILQRVASGICECGIEHVTVIMSLDLTVMALFALVSMLLCLMFYCVHVLLLRAY